jgi:hypothetical protein
MNRNSHEAPPGIRPRPRRRGHQRLRRVRQLLRGARVRQRDRLHHGEEPRGGGGYRRRSRRRQPSSAARGLHPPRGPAQWAGLAAVAIVGGSVPFILFFEGLARVTSTDAAFIQKTLVIWVALLAVPLLRERIGPWHLAAIAALVWGQAILGGGIGGIRPVPARR